MMRFSNSGNQPSGSAARRLDNYCDKVKWDETGNLCRRSNLMKFNPVEEPPLKYPVSIFIAHLDKTDKER